MAIVRIFWKLLRGMGLLAFLASLLVVVLAASCLASLFSGNALTDRPGKLRIEA